MTISNTLNETNQNKPAENTNMMGRKRKRAPFECIICMVSYKINIPHKTTKCNHSVCRECARKYFNAALKNNRYTSYETIECPSPDCKEYFVTEDTLQAFFSQAEIKRWWNSAIMKTFVQNKVQCPLPGCKAVFDVDVQYTKQCTFTECYECRRGFCIACQSAWHPGVIRVMNDEEDVKMTLKKAEINAWTRCPKCDHLVEKSSGCTFMTCICGTTFCYRCGGYSKEHACKNKCQEYSKEELLATRKPMFEYKKKARRAA